MNINNCLNELSIVHLVDTFSNCFFFLLVNPKDLKYLNAHQDKLKNIYKDLLIKQDIMLIISDINIKNNIATLIPHICKGQEIIAKSVHYAINVNLTKAELFAIRCRINHTIYLQDVTHIIIIIIDAILATK